MTTGFTAQELENIQSWIASGLYTYDDLAVSFQCKRDDIRNALEGNDIIRIAQRDAC